MLAFDRSEFGIKKPARLVRGAGRMKPCLDGYQPVTPRMRVVIIVVIIIIVRWACKTAALSSASAAVEVTLFCIGSQKCTDDAPPSTRKEDIAGNSNVQ
ncbi:hypothetical protein H9L15_00985 [Sphingomonas daechungensis]|uniref:Uncharacterized protein n=1 Tax=Sphingomonas daechungensis TaxID=1176646 RepID=A0ABX6T2I2_9SPHN|nr:hypothetical protein [Sphingomonas daechungensis]QNP43438.1 hypothetical protein H9L15_00985 [Sphingomonas daechungensis]